jgi:Tfp pilus assembly protein PilX
MKLGLHLTARKAMPTPRSKNEDGGSLIIVLVFIAVFGLIVAGLLTEAGASVAYTKVVTDHEKKVYAADAGVALGIQQLQQRNTLCPVTGSSTTIQTIQVNGIDTEVTCETTSGSTTGGLGYAIYTLSPDSDSLEVQQGDAKEVSGPVHVTGGVDGLNKGLIVTKGDFSQLSTNGCNAKTYSGVGGVTTQTGFDKYCLTSQPDQPTYSAPTSFPTAAPTPQIRGNCKIFYPGRYNYSLSDFSLSTAFDLARTNYFASGVYYFRSSFSFTGTGTDNTFYFGGMPASYESVKFSSERNAATCARDTEAAAAAAAASPSFPYDASTAVAGSGVEFVFGNGATLTVDNKSRAELFERTADGTQEKASPTVAVVPSTWAATWETNPIHTMGVTFTPGADKALVVHGVTYAPEHNVYLKLTTAVDAVAFGGIVAWKVELDSSEGGAGTGLVINGRNGTPKPRRVIVKGTSPPTSSTSAGKSVVSTALISIENDDNKTIQIETWRTRAPDQTL